jgi:hypothetical protein
MSLRSDVWFVTSLIGSAIRQILGETFRHLADYLLREDQSATTATEVNVEVPKTPPRTRHKATTQREVISQEPPPDVEVKPAKPRDRSKYRPKEHGQYKVAAVGILRTLLSNDVRLSAPELHKINKNSTDSTIRTACKTMVSDGLLATELDTKKNSDVYWVLNREAAQLHLTELEAVAPVLPTSEESGEPQPSLN